MNPPPPTPPPHALPLDTSPPRTEQRDVLLIGARGAVGAAIAARLLAAGISVTPAGRTRPEGGVSLNLGPDAGPAEFAALRAAAAGHRAVVNASGAERPEIAEHLAGAQLIDISASADYLGALAARGEPGEAALVLGVGLAPGLTTALVWALHAQPGDEVDVAVMLGSGESHGPAAVAWTAGLLGADLAEPAEDTPVRNLRERRVFAEEPRGRGRGYLRADFPDHTLLRIGGAPGGEPPRSGQGVRVRSYLALSSRVMTGSLGLLARVPRLSGLLRRVPPLGDERWAVTAVHRASGRLLRATGVNQSRATAELTAAAILAALDRGPRPGITLVPELLGLPELGRLPGITVLPEAPLPH